MKHLAYISIGTNQIEPADARMFFLNVMQLLEIHCGEINNHSHIYLTDAWGMNPNTKQFLNAVIELKTSSSPEKLLDNILCLEQMLQSGFKNVRHFEDRTLDLDILFYDSEIIVTESLIVPHPLMHLRHFCVLPMFQLNAGYIHPVLEITMQQLAKHFQNMQVRTIEFE